MLGGGNEFRESLSWPPRHSTPVRSLDLGVLAELVEEGSRYQDLHDTIAGIFYKVLTDTLRPTERLGLVARHLGANRVETATLY